MSSCPRLLTPPSGMQYTHRSLHKSVTDRRSVSMLRPKPSVSSGLFASQVARSFIGFLPGKQGKPVRKCGQDGFKIFPRGFGASRQVYN